MGPRPHLELVKNTHTHIHKGPGPLGLGTHGEPEAGNSSPMSCVEVIAPVDNEVLADRLILPGSLARELVCTCTRTCRVYCIL